MISCGGTGARLWGVDAVVFILVTFLDDISSTIVASKKDVGSQFSKNWVFLIHFTY